ncbi:MAG TPA: TonB-dependent receptor [Caulobacterales bacterium]|nr:TonB-dependent receptor [Caulobacterales bacterium]
MKFNTKKSGLLAGTVLGGAALASMFATPALAQDAQPSASASESEEVIVTVTRRSEDILNVPYNITAVTGQQIEQARMRDSTELLRSVAGVSVVDRGERNSAVINGVRIRGLNVDSAALGDYAVSAVSTVSTYVNDTPIFANFLLTDIAQVEVLRGPQATLYGSGALGGTVKYVMNAPKLGEFGGHGQVSGSQVDGSDGIGWGGDLTVNIPLGDTLALRASVARADYPGITDYVNLYQLDANGIPVAPSGVLNPAASYYSKKDADTVDIWFGRASLLFKPTDTFDLTLNYFHQEDDIGGRRGQVLGANGYGQPYGDHQSGSIQLEPSDRNLDIVSAEANLDLGFATLTSSTSWYDHEGSSISENTGFYAHAGFLSFYYNYPRPMASAVRTFEDKSTVQEFRLVTDDGGNFDYVLGVYYQDQNRVATQNSYLRGFKRWWDTAFPAFAAAVTGDQDFGYSRDEDFTDQAVFGELTWHVSPRLDITGGVRWFDNESKNTTYMSLPLYAGLFTPQTTRFDISDSGTLWKLNAAYHFGDDDLFYATWSQGYRRGGTNAVPTTGNFAEDPRWQTYDPDTVDNYEVGVKGRIGGQRYDASLFYIDWQDAQLNTATPAWGFYAVQNAGSAHSAGLELALSGPLGNGFDYSLGYTYLNAELDEDFYSPIGTLIDRKGHRLPGAPENMINGALDWSHPVGNFTFTARVDGSYQSSTRNAISLSPLFNVDLKGFAIFNTVATLSTDRWDFSVWVKNIGNEEGVTGEYTQAYMGTDPGQGYYGNGSKDLISLPRTFGATVGFRF